MRPGSSSCSQTSGGLFTSVRLAVFMGRAFVRSPSPPASTQKWEISPELLRDPGVLQGTLPVEMGREADHLALAEREDVEAMVSHLGFAPPHAPAVVYRHHDVSLVRVEYLVDHDVEVLERLEVGAQSLVRRLVSADDPDVWSHVREVHLIVRVVEVADGVR